MSVSVAEERKLRAGWEALDEQNPKAALKVAAAVLKKRPASQAARALKAVALLRQGTLSGDASARAEAEAVADALLREAPTDETVIYALLQVEKHAGHAERITPLYRALWDASPGSEDAAQRVFLSCVRDGNYDEQQRVAAQMLARFPRSQQRLQWWRAASLFCRAEAERGARRPQLLALCEALVRDARVATAAEAEFAACVLRGCGRWELLAALLAPDGALGRRWVCAEEREAARADALMRCGCEAQAREAFAALLRLPQTLLNWDHFAGFIDATVALLRESGDSDSDSSGALVEEARKLFAELQTTSAEGATNRGPLLAVAELEKRVSQGPDALLAALAEFVARFSSKPSCALDVRPFAEELVLRRGVSAADLAKRLEVAALGAREPTDEQLDEASINSRIFVLETQRMLGLHASEEATLKAAETALELFFASKPREHGAPSAGDEAALLFYAAMLDRAKQTRSVAPLYDAAALLEMAIAQNSNACQARLCLIECYLLLGAPKPAADNMWSKELGIKNILIESVSHIFAGEGERFGDTRGAVSSLLDAVLALHHENDALNPDNVLQAYTAENYQKAAEFLAFRARLQRSAMLAFARTQTVLLRLPILSRSPSAAAARLAAIKPEDLPPLPSSDDEALECTADLDLMLYTQWCPIPAPAKQIPPFLEVKAIRLRRCALRTLAAFARLDFQAIPAECEALSTALTEAGLFQAPADVSPDNLEAASWTLFVRLAQAHAAGFAFLQSKSKEDESKADAALQASFSEKLAGASAMLSAVAKTLASSCENLSRAAIPGHISGISASVVQGLFWCSVLNHVLLGASDAASKKPRKHRGPASQQPSMPHSAAAPEVRDRCKGFSAELASLARAASGILAGIAALPPDSGVPAEPSVKMPEALAPHRAAVISDVAASHHSVSEHLQLVVSFFK